jgi:endonuclease/exonuclease/phosphatase (EEP) superfamily protein YafD
MLSRDEFRGALLALAALLTIVLAIVSLGINLPGALLLQSLRLHLIAGGIGLLALLVISGARWRAGLFAAVLVVAGVHAGQFILEYQERRSAPLGPAVAELSVISFNVLTGNRRAAEAVEFLAGSDADVVVVMETPGIAGYLDRMRDAFPYSIGCENPQTCDISIHSRLPIEAGEIRTMRPFHFERLAIAPVVIAGNKVTIVGVHLSKPYFDGASGAELFAVSRTLSQIEGPVVLAGDFNAAVWSGPMVRLGRDQQLAPGPFYPATWPVRAGPVGVPIDNILTRGTARIMALSAGSDSFGSNHRPLLARIELYEAP